MASVFMTRRRAAMSALCLAVPSSFVRAEPAWPAKPITIVVSLQAGSGSDVASRVVADHLARKLGVAVIVENAPGAGGVMGASRLFNAKPDGYTLGALNNGLVCLVPNLPGKPAFDIDQLTPVSKLADLPSVLVVPASLPVNDLRGFVAWSKAHPGKLSYGSVGPGSPQHIAMEMLKNTTGADLVHVPYRGGPQAVADLIAGQIQATWIALVVAVPFIKSGQLKALAVGGNARSVLLPDAPTLKEGGVGDFEYLPWLGLYGPPGLPTPITASLHRAVQQVLQDPAVVDKLIASGLEAAPMSRETFARRTASERLEMANVINRMKLG